MTKLIISTVHRHASFSESSGFLYVVDLDGRETLIRTPFVEPPMREFDRNPRGGMRGCRGIVLNQDHAFISNFSMVVHFDSQWNVLRVISHPSCSGIHDIFISYDTVWVTSTSNDLLIQFNNAGDLIHFINLRDHSLWPDKLNWKPRLLNSHDDIVRGKTDFRNPKYFNPVTYNVAHVNSVCTLNSGDMLVSLGRISGIRYRLLLQLQHWLIQRGWWYILKDTINKIEVKGYSKKDVPRDDQVLLQRIRGTSVVQRLTNDGSIFTCLLLCNMTIPSHSLFKLAEEAIIYLNSSRGHVINFNPLTGEILFDKKISNGFLRGITSVNDNLLVLGNRREIILFDLQSRSVVDRMEFTQEVNESVFAIQVIPSHFVLPPSNLSQHIYDQTGCSSSSALLK